MIRTVSPSIIRSLRLYIQHQVYVIQVLWLFASKQPQNLYGMLLYVQSETPDDGRRDRPKHVECCSKIKQICDIVLLVGFTIEIYYDARSYKRQILSVCLSVRM